jgi:hypothetical protein
MRTTKEYLLYSLHDASEHQTSKSSTKRSTRDNFDADDTKHDRRNINTKHHAKKADVIYVTNMTFTNSPEDREATRGGISTREAVWAVAAHQNNLDFFFRFCSVLSFCGLRFEYNRRC